MIVAVWFRLSASNVGNPRGQCWVERGSTNTCINHQSPSYRNLSGKKNKTLAANINATFRLSRKFAGTLPHTKASRRFNSVRSNVYVLAVAAIVVVIDISPSSFFRREYMRDLRFCETAAATTVRSRRRSSDAYRSDQPFLRTAARTTGLQLRHSFAERYVVLVRRDVLLSSFFLG